jgi:hypothetical protein
MTEMIEWFRWRLRKKRKRLQELSSIPDIRIIRIPQKGIRAAFKNGTRRFTAVQDGLRKQFPGLTKDDWWK